MDAMGSAGAAASTNGMSPSPGIPSAENPLKLIIDTDPGCAYNSPELHIIGLTTMYGNVHTDKATANALTLVEMAGQSTPVAAGASHTLTSDQPPHIADFVGSPIATSAAEFIVQQVNANPGEITILALASLTNIALALHKDPSIAHKWRDLVVLGGAFHVSGNVNPAAEANMYGDPEAADFVLGHGGVVHMVGLNVTHECVMEGRRLRGMHGRGRFGTFLANITRFYVGYHRQAYKMDAAYSHDPTALAAVLRPDLFTYRPGRVRVVTDGLAKGATLFDEQDRTWHKRNEWSGRPAVMVATQVEARAVVELLFERMQR